MFDCCGQALNLISAYTGINFSLFGGYWLVPFNFSLKPSMDNPQCHEGQGFSVQLNSLERSRQTDWQRLGLIETDNVTDRDQTD